MYSNPRPAGDRASTPSSAAPPVFKPRRNPWPGLVGVAVLAGVIGGVAWWSQDGVAPATPATAAATVTQPATPALETSVPAAQAPAPAPAPAVAETPAAPSATPSPAAPQTPTPSTPAQ